MAGDRRLAGAIKPGEEGALTCGRRHGGGIVDGQHKLPRRGVAFRDFDDDDALRHGGQHVLGAHDLRNMCRKPQPVEAGTGQEGCIGKSFRQFAQARFDIAAETDGIEVLPEAQGLRRAAHRR